MNILELKNVSKSFFTQNLYKNVNLEINSQDKIALIGKNGTGKSTFIKLIMGEEYPSSGKVIRNEEATISCFDQFGKLNLEKTVKELLDIPFENIIALQNELEHMATQFTDNLEENEIIMEKYSALSDKFESLGGYSYIHVQSEFIDTFELADKLDKTYGQLSGGEKQYIRLAITLFSSNDLIILDEPLSFFDRKKTAWLSNYINESTKAFLIISHNVDFIRNFANKIFDIDNYSITSYECGYNEFLKEKKLKLAEEKKENQKIDSIIQDTENAVRRKYVLLEKCNNKHAHAVILRRMQRELYKLNKSKIKFSPETNYEYILPPENISFFKREISDEIVKLSNISKEYPNKLLYIDTNLDITKDTKICIFGENGSGKSTLLRIIAGLEEPTTGTVIRNEKAKISFIEQETNFEDENMYIKDYLKEVTGLSDDFIEASIETLYDNEPEFKDKRIFMLSGGEKKRLEIFAKTLLETDLLIIDEPSTYMDEYSRNAVANMLLEYPGAIVLVSHDKALLKKLNFKTYDIRDKRFRVKEISK